MNEIGRWTRIQTPFGPRLISYADLTASGRYLHFVEAWLGRVRPFYANTHTAVSATGRALTLLREEARDRIAEQIHAGDDHVVVFCGSGATTATNKLVGLLGLRVPDPLDHQYHFTDQIPDEERPVVFVGPFEHHSNYLPWLESIAKVIEIPTCPNGAVDLTVLEAGLIEHAARPLKLGAFSAASNVTGVIVDVAAIARLMHAHGGKIVIDYAAGGPYMPIVMEASDPAESLDAMVLSPHKFLGGPGGSGLLVARRELFVTETPERPGGGTVDYVGSVDNHAVDYVKDLAAREEGGTPAIMADLRAGAAFLVKSMVGGDVILAHEKELAARSIARLAAHPKITVLGPQDADRLAIISIMIEDLHHDFASGLLDHLFGVQSRSGCACAGPYGHRLLGIDHAHSSRFRALVGSGYGGMKPGWVRLSLPYYASAEDIDFILSAVEFVAEHGTAFLSTYRFNWSNGVWNHLTRDVGGDRPIELTAASLAHALDGDLPGDPEVPMGDAELAAERAGYFEVARQEAAALAAEQAATPPAWNPGSGNAEVDELVWFKYIQATTL